jgi:hypothetical protein
MKKNFSLTSPVHRADRVAESVKAEINKYVARERRKALPEGVDFWSFDCKCGASEETAAVIHVNEFSQAITKVAAQSDRVYVEIFAKPGVHAKKLNASEPE